MKITFEVNNRFQSSSKDEMSTKVNKILAQLLGKAMQDNMMELK